MDKHRVTYSPAVFLWAAITLLLLPVAVFSADSNPKLSTEDKEILRNFEERILRIKQRREDRRQAVTESLPSIPAEKEVSAEEAHQGSFPLSTKQETAEEIRSASDDLALLEGPQEERPRIAPVELSPSETVSVEPQLDHLHMRVAALERQLNGLENRSSHPLGFSWLALGISMAGWVLVLRNRSAKPKQVPAEEEIPESFAGEIMSTKPGRYAESEEILPWPPSGCGPDSSSGYLNTLVQNANQSFQKGYYPQADALYSKLLELQPHNFALHCGIAELNLLAGRYAAGWEFVHFSLPRFHQPDKTSVLTFVALATGRLSGRETEDLEKQFNQIMQEDFEVNWNLEDMQQWLFTAEIPKGIREEIVKEIGMLRSHVTTAHHSRNVGIENLNTSPHREKEKLCSG